MKLERLHESLLPFFVILGALFLAITAGSMAGTGRSGAVYIVIGAIVTVAFFFFVRERIWLLIPATWMLGGQVSILPVPFTVAHLAILFAFGTFLLLKAFKINRFKPKIGLVEIWLLVVLAYLATVYIRNPVGVEAFGSDRIGGRPYINIIIAFLGYWVLARAIASPRQAAWVPIFVIWGNAFHAIINEIAYRYPSLVQPLAKLYSGIAAAENPDAQLALPGEGTERKAHFAGWGASAWQYACCRWRPFTVINPLYGRRFLFFLFATYTVLQSGFRSALFGMMVVFVMGTYFRRGWGEVFRGILIGFVGLAILVAMQGTIIDLPLPAQRALSFLPGNWDYAAKSEAEGSTEWRIEMWKAMLTGNKYIQNKWLGDGFGFTHHQLEIMAANATTGSTADQQENLMISGGVHSGPITAIRYVGYVGLVLFLIFLCLVARRAVRLIRRAENTPYYTLALFIGIPSIIQPFAYVFIFGAFESDLPHAIIAVGFQRMLENSLDAYQPESIKEKQAPAPLPPPPKFRRPPEFVRVG